MAVAEPAIGMTTFVDEYARLYPGEVAALLESRDPDEIAAILGREPLDVMSQVFAALTPGVGASVLGRLPDPQAGAVLRSVDPSRGAVLLAGLERERREQLLDALPAAEARELRDLLSYPPETAGSLMSARMATFRPEATVADVRLRLRGGPGERVSDAILVDASARLVGTVSLEALAVAEPETVVAQLVQPASVFIQALAPRDEVVAVMTQAGGRSVPVVDVDGRLLGMLQQDALVRAVEADATVDLQKMVGASGEERALSSVGFAVRKRLPWLQINLATAFLAASVVGIFEDTIQQVTALAVLLPVVAGQSGNTGAQALAVTIRGLALREIRLRHWRRVTLKEAAVALIIGLGVAATTSLGVYVWSRSAGLALVIGMSMIISMLAAGLAGAAVPLVLAALKQDPAQSSSIILTTVTDVVGFFSFLGIASLFMSMLL